MLLFKRRFCRLFVGEVGDKIESEELSSGWTVICKLPFFLVGEVCFTASGVIIPIYAN